MSDSDQIADNLVETGNETTENNDTAGVESVEQTESGTESAAPQETADSKAEPDKPADKKEPEESDEVAEAKAKEMASLARLRSQILKNKRAAQAEAQRIAAEKARVSSIELQLQKELELLKSDPMGFVKRHGVTGEDFAAQLEPKQEPKPEDQIAQLAAKLAEYERREQERELKAQRDAVARQIQSQADEFADWLVQSNSESYPALAAMLEGGKDSRNEVLSSWKYTQDRASKSGYSYSNDEVAEFLEARARPYIEKIAEAFSKRTKKPTTTATQSKAATGNSNAGKVPQSIPTSATGQRSSVPRSESMETSSDDPEIARLLAEYKKIAGE